MPSLQSYVGTFQVPASTGTQTVTGIVDAAGSAFTPKAVFFFGNRRNSNGSDPRIEEGFGYMSAADQCSIGVGQSISGGADAFSKSRNSSAWVMTGSNGAVIHEFDYSSFASGEFTVDWTTVRSSGFGQTMVKFLALGGDDLTNVALSTISSPTVTGNASVTGLGFKPDGFMTLSIGRTTADANTDRNRSSIGWADRYGNQGSNGVFTLHLSNPVDSYSVQRTDRCVSVLQDGGSTLLQASFVSMDSDGYTLNWDTVSGSSIIVFGIAFKGFFIKGGSLQTPTSTTDVVVDDLNFTPTALLALTAGQPSGSSITSFYNRTFGFAAHNDEASQSYGVLDGETQESSTQRLSGEILNMAETQTGWSTTNLINLSVKSFDVNGFTLECSLADSTQREVLWFAFGAVDRPMLVDVGAAETTGAPSVTLHCWESAAGGVSTTISVDKPTSGSTGPSAKDAEIGDVLVIIVGNDDDTTTDQWDNTTLKPTGFELINEAGGSTSDSHVAAFYKVVDGTEGSSFSVTSQSSDDLWAVCVLVSGVDNANPLDVVGSDIEDGTPPIAITGVNTTVDNCLAFYVASYDGGDFSAFSVGGSWTERGEHQSTDTSSVGAGGTWGTLLQATAGATGTATVSATVSDGMAGFTFALRAGSTPITPDWPAGHKSDDIGLLLVTADGITGSAPSTWASVADSPQDEGSNVSLEAFWKRATGTSETSPSVSIRGTNHTIGLIAVYRGCYVGGNPWDVTSGGTSATSNTSLSITGDTTTRDKTRVVAIAAVSDDVTASAWANSDLADVREILDVNTSTGNAGAILAAEGYKVSAGAFGSTTATLSGAATKAFIAIALLPNTTNWVKTLSNTRAFSTGVLIRIEGAKRAISNSISPTAAVERQEQAVRSASATGTISVLVSRAGSTFERNPSATGDVDAVVARTEGAVRAAANEIEGDPSLSRAGSSYLRTQSNSRSASAVVSRAGSTFNRVLTNSRAFSTAGVEFLMTAVRSLSLTGAFTGDLVRVWSTTRELEATLDITAVVARIENAIRASSNSRSGTNVISRAGSTYNREATNEGEFTAELSGLRVLIELLENAHAFATAELARVWATSRSLSFTGTIDSEVARAATLLKAIANTRAFATAVVTRIEGAVRTAANTRSATAVLARIWSTSRTAENEIEFDSDVSRAASKARSLSRTGTIDGDPSTTGSTYNRAVDVILDITSSVTGFKVTARLAEVSLDITATLARVWDTRRALSRTGTLSNVLSRSGSAFVRTSTNALNITAVVDSTRLFVRAVSRTGTFTSVVARLGVFLRALSRTGTVTGMLASRKNAIRGLDHIGEYAVTVSDQRGFVRSLSGSGTIVSSLTRVKKQFRSLTYTLATSAAMEFIFRAGRRTEYIGTFAATVTRSGVLSTALSWAGTFSANLFKVDGFARILKFNKDAVTRIATGFGISKFFKRRN